jgi:hypothetical protein
VLPTDKDRLAAESWTIPTKPIKEH